MKLYEERLTRVPTLAGNTNHTAETTVRQATAEDEAAILRFLAHNLPDRDLLSTPEYYRWRHRSGPWGDAIGSSVLAFHDQEMIGYMGAICDRLWDGQRWHACHWLVNLWIVSQYRGGLECLQMLRSAMCSEEPLLATGIHPRMLPLYQSLGWHHVDSPRSFFFVMRPSALLRMARDSEEAGVRGGWLPIARVADQCMAPIRLALCRQPSQATLGSVDYLATSELFKQRVSMLGVSTDRGEEMLSWKLRNRPCGSISQISLWADSLRGHLIVKEMERPGVARWLEVMDYMLDGNRPEEVLRHLLRRATRFAHQQDCDFIRFRMSHPPDVEAMRRQRWWIQARHRVSDDVFCYHSDNRLLRQIASRSWFITSWVSDRCDYGGDDRRLR